jgi:hypothetical protein
MTIYSLPPRRATVFGSFFKKNNTSPTDQQGFIEYDLDKHEVHVIVKVLVRQHILKEYRQRTAGKDRLIPGTVFEVLTLNSC